MDVLVPGDVVGERYRVLDRLGAGGMGTVYRVEHTLMAKEMAMKLLRPEFSAIKDVTERFEREARSAARLDDPHIVRVTDFGRAEDGAMYLVMELLEGEPLSGRIREKGALDVEEALGIAREILAGLEHAHGNGVIHRDLKPDNVMLVPKDGGELVKILDFGLAKITRSEDADSAPLTRAGMVFGTPKYMSPEQASAEPTDGRSDLYSVGVILFEMLKGEPPFRGESTVQLLTAHLTQPPPPLGLDLGDAERAEALERIARTALAKEPKERFQSAREFREALEACLVPAQGRRPRSEPEASGGPAGEFTSPLTGQDRRAPSPAVAHDPTRPRGDLSRGEMTRNDRPDTVAEARSTSPSAALGRPKRPWVAYLVLLALGAVVAFGVRSIGGDPADETGRFEAAIDAGDLEGAHAILERLRSESPGGARTYLAEGHLALARGARKKAIEAYRRALAADGALASDPRFARGFRRLLLEEEKAENVKDLLSELAKHGVDAVAPLLVEVFEEAERSEHRRRAYAGLKVLGKSGAPKDALGLLIQDLGRQEASACKTRRWYVEQIAELRDPRVLPALEREREKTGTFFDFARVNGCMSKLLDEEIRKRESK